jgi:hypothetical protein
VLSRRLDTVLERDVIHRQHDLESMVQGKPVSMPTAFVATLAATTAVAAVPSSDIDSKKANSVDAVIPGASASAPKQGAYGKVKIHTEPLWSQLTHLDEVFAAAAFKLGWVQDTKVKPLDVNASEARVSDALRPPTPQSPR